MSADKYSTHAGLVGMAALWGASWPWGQVVAQSMPPLAAASIRFILASVVLVFWLYRRGGTKSLFALNIGQWAGMGCASAVGVLGYSIFFLLSLQIVPAGKAAMVVALNPVLTMMFAVVLFREKVNLTMGTGVVLAVTGALYALTDGGLLAIRLGQSGMGELLLLGCAGCWVGYTLIGRMVLTTVDSLTTTTVTSAIGAVLLFSASMMLEGPAAWSGLRDTPAMAWLSIVGLALGATALAYAWYMNGIKVLGAGAAAAYMSLVPLFGMLLSSLWLGESLTTSLVGGGALAISGMLLINRGWLSLARAPKNPPESRQ
ncbi:MAG: DMT family transporter [Gammaproteobacteria bacterium]|nr:DMT family transporter [Gammaproteobacteria bacterium]